MKMFCACLDIRRVGSVAACVGLDYWKVYMYTCTYFMYRETSETRDTSNTHTLHTEVLMSPTMYMYLYYISADFGTTFKEPILISIEMSRLL